MKRIICYIFGHLPYTFNGGSFESPEQAWGCSYCGKDLSDERDYRSLDLNSKVTKYFQDKEMKRYNNLDIQQEDIPF